MMMIMLVMMLQDRGDGYTRYKPMMMITLVMMLQDRGRQLHTVQSYDDDNVDDDVTG